MSTETATGRARGPILMGAESAVRRIGDTMKAYCRFGAEDDVSLCGTAYYC